MSVPVVLGAAVDPGWSLAIAAAALFLVTEPIMGQVVEPMLYGRSTGLSPVSVVISAIFWAWIWGPIGLILATPLTLCLVVLGRHVDRLEFLDVVLGDRPALTPVENFYQRVLAGDPDEALDQAELLLKERSLSSYYDEVALSGLRLAAKDVARGVVTAIQLGRIHEAVHDLIDGLEDHPDTDPSPSEAEEDIAGATGAEQRLPKQPAPDLLPPRAEARPAVWRSQTPVLCIGGRGPLDEAVAAMLAQLLRKHDLGARVLSRDAVSRAQIAALDPDGISMVCISYLEIAGTPSQLRYLVRRIRGRLPAASIVVGFWPADSPIMDDQNVRTALGAEHYVTSFRQAITACLATARSASDAEQQPGKSPLISRAARYRRRVSPDRGTVVIGIRGRFWQISPDLLGVLKADACCERANPAWLVGLSSRTAKCRSSSFSTPRIGNRLRLGSSIPSDGPAGKVRGGL